MSFVNTDNEIWNSAHQGMRVPINDTSIEGAAFAISSADPEWANGSVNKAVYNTYILNNPIPVEDEESAETGVMDFHTLNKYVNKDMLWGFSSDARNKLPGDLMSYRAYPTPIVSHDLALITAYTVTFINLNGTPGNTGEFLVVKHALILTYPLPYDVVYRMNLEINAVPQLVDYEYVIHAGNLLSSGYRDASQDDVDGVPITTFQSTLNQVYISLNTIPYTGDITITADITSIVQSPYYGSLVLDTVVIPQADYRPVVIPTVLQVSSLPGFPGIPYGTYNAIKAACTELITGSDFLLSTQLAYNFYTTTGTFVIGATLYVDALGTVLAASVLAPGSYMLLSGPLYGTPPTQAYLISTYFIFDAASKIIFFEHPPIGYLGAGCGLPATGGSFSNGITVTKGNSLPGTNPSSEQISGVLTVTGGSISYKVSAKNQFNYTNDTTAELTISGIGTISVQTDGSYGAKLSVGTLTVPPGTYNYTLKVTLNIIFGFSSGAGTATIVQQ